LILGIWYRFSKIGHFLDPVSNTVKPVCLKANQIQFNADGSVTLTLFGIKNDANRTGFEIRITKSERVKIDPVRCLKDYMDRTKSCRGPDGPVFISITALL
jgi:hypothetical protein